MKKLTRILVLLSVVAAILPASQPSSARGPDCTYWNVDWGAFAADTEKSSRARMYFTITLIDVHRLWCDAQDFGDAIREIARHFARNPCAVLDTVGVSPGGSIGTDAIVEVNFQSELWLNPKYAGEAHFFIQDPSCGYEQLLILASNPATSTAVVGYGEDWTPDRSVLTYFGYKQGGFLGLGSTAVVSVPGCASGPSSDPVDPIWGPGTPALPTPAGAGFPWATSPYDATGMPPFGAVNGDGSCLHLDYEMIVEVGEEIEEFVAVPDAVEGEIQGRVDRYAFALPGGGNAIIYCATLQGDASTADPCSSIGGTLLETVWVLVEAEAYEPGAPRPVTIAICTASLFATSFGFGMTDLPFITGCEA